MNLTEFTLQLFEKLQSWVTPQLETLKQKNAELTQRLEQSEQATATRHASLQEELAQNQTLIKTLSDELNALKSINLDDVIQQKVDAIELPKGDPGPPGKDGAPGKDGKNADDSEQLKIHEQKLANLEALDIPALITEKLAEIELPKGDPGPPGKDGAPGEPGKNADDSEKLKVLELKLESLESLDIPALITEKLAQIELPKGEKGDPGPPGKDGAPGKDGKNADDSEQLKVLQSDFEKINSLDVGALIADEVAKIELPQGPAGKDALQQIEFIGPINFEKSYPRGVYGYHNGSVYRSYSETDGQRGWDIFLRGMPDEPVTLENERTLSINMGQQKHSVQIPVAIYRGQWKEGTAYDVGDIVSLRGSTWHNNVPENTTRPNDHGTKGQEPSGWTMQTRAGRNGKDYEPKEDKEGKE